jgi:hypothetical protein
VNFLNREGPFLRAFGLLDRVNVHKRVGLDNLVPFGKFHHQHYAVSLFLVLAYLFENKEGSESLVGWTMGTVVAAFLKVIAKIVHKIECT